MKPLSATIKNLCRLLALAALLLPPGLARAGIATEVFLNKSVLVNLHTKSQRVSIAAPEIAELVVISPTQLQINGKKIGSTSLIVWEVGGKTSFFDIQVKGDAALLESRIQEMAPKDSIRVEFVNDTLLLSGKAANEQTVDKAVQIARAYVSSSAGSEAKAPADAPLDATISYQAAGERSDREAGGGSGRQGIKVLNQIQIDDPQQVLLEVKVAQVDKSALKSLGVSAFIRGASAEGFSNMVGAPSGQLTILNPDGSVKSQATGLAGPIPGLASIQPLDPYQLGVSLFKPGLSTVLKALVTKNLAKVLAEPNLLVKSGQTGKFLAGSKIPFSYVSGVGSLSTTSIQFIDVGVKLNFKPEVLESGLISLKIDPAEVSSITGTLAVNGYPIIDTREVRTQVQLKDGESLVLAGLLQEESIKVMSKMPILGDIPILGALFRSTQDNKTEKELVFFITPRIVKANAPGTKPALPTDKPITPEQERELQWIPLFN
ncbi:pilus assembly protein N-terminal domain-containing protein [Geomonas sp. Red32]|uniref:type II and III secretion system protein family protein n=1 Tax=Geomonas sp. Red32 TaxID=2912856 RepID=UPI00202CAFDD|nr:pilus assembly protein N-terminal domain-containing protein [Geomonas sp. Red32]MCM0083899.1 pilus assembly protein N-terminal domain-containing protein [Geomonas sp. Red32]